MGLPQHISREGCAAAEPAVSQEGKLVHTCDTLGGNSGSPVFRVSDRKVVGLHHAGNSQAGFNYAIPMARILANSQVLKASIPVDPVRPSETGSSCDLLWAAAQEYGCSGYQTFIETCGDHPLRPLAKTLKNRDCRAEDVKILPVPNAGDGDAGAERLLDWQAELIANARQSKERCDSHLGISEGYMDRLGILKKEARDLIILHGKKPEVIKNAAAALKLTWEDLKLLMPETYMLMDHCDSELDRFLASQDESEMRAIYTEI